MTKRVLAAALLLSVVSVPMYADFNRIARAIDSHDGVKRIWIPFLGVARVLVRAVHPEGVQDFQLATFEGGNRVDPREMHALLESKLDKGFAPLVQVRSKKSGESSFIYARPHGRHLELMVLVVDGDDTVLVRVVVDPEVVVRELDEPRNVRRVASRH